MASGIVGLQMGELLAGAIVIENVFNLPGLGRLVFLAIAVIPGILPYSREGSVAVIHLEGDLSTGDFSSPDAAGSDYIGREIRDAADNPLVQAIVLRVNSPPPAPHAVSVPITEGFLSFKKTS
jgi:protease-4